jgi:hypothetical protein
MDLTGQIVLAYLEEDDARHVLFRARPLLTATGPVSQEDIDELEQDGFLRIAPDKQEQHSFKDRMRSLGFLCLMNLSDAASALGKIRLNKNYTQGKGEHNRYIVYSDAMQPLPEGLLFEVVLEERGVQPLTKQYYLRSGGRISGPHCISDDGHCPASHSLPPDCDRLFLVEMPDKVNRMFYWPQPEKLEPQLEQAAIAPHEPQQPHADVGHTADSERVEPLLALEKAHQALLSAGFLIARDQTAELLSLCLSSRFVQLSGDCLADALLAAKTMTAVFPFEISASPQGFHDEPEVQIRLLYSAGPIIPADYTSSYQQSPWPVFHLISGEAWPVLADKPQASSLAALREALDAQPEGITGKIKTRMEELRQRMSKGGYPLPLMIRRDMAHYVWLAPLVGDISQEEALRSGVRFWVLPWMRFCGVKESEITELTRL